MDTQVCDWITWEWRNIGASASIHICSQFQNWIHWLTNWKTDHYREWEPTGKKVPTTIWFYQLASYIKQSNLATGYLHTMHINANNSIAHLCRLCHRLYKDSPQKTKSSLKLIKTNGNPSVKMANLAKVAIWGTAFLALLFHFSSGFCLLIVIVKIMMIKVIIMSAYVQSRV